jgi:hypothetical protein
MSAQHQVGPHELELAEVRRAWAKAETMLAAALALLPRDMPVQTLREKRDELDELLAGFTLARRHLRELCVRAQRSPYIADVEAFLARLDRIDLARSREGPQQRDSLRL